MTQLVTINGLPRKLRLDAWWFSADLDVDVPEPPMWADRAKRDWRKPALIAVGLVVLADWLFWGWDVGVSLALFAAVLAGLALFAQSRKTNTKDGVKAAGIALLAILPIIEQMQFLSVLMLLIGLSAYAVWLASDHMSDWIQHAKAMLKFTLKGPFLILIDAWDGAETVRENKTLKANVGREIMSWLLPLSLGFIFLTLFSGINPFLEKWMNGLFSYEAPDLSIFRRVIFWLAILCLVWPFLNLITFAVRLPMAAKVIKASTASPIVNAKSVQNSLVLFNVLFAVQIVTDGLYLWGGAALPDGMTYASYAHRGAYPLIATALLAAGFAIMTQRFQKARLVRWLVFAWIGQNLMLTYAAIYRLQLYVDAYALTYLRVAAFVWMALVFVGLTLIMVQMGRRLSVGWLLKWNIVTLVAVLYVSGFVNFTSVIASYNTAHLDGSTPGDRLYVCQLGPQALPTILDYEAVSDRIFCPSHSMPVYTAAAGWRDWGFRDWRLERYLAGQIVYD